MKPLTAQELKVAKLIASRKTVPAIALQLGTAESTIRVHSHSIVEKLELNSPNPLYVHRALQSYKHHHIGKNAASLELTPGERKVLELRAEGKTFHEIAAIRQCSSSTARNLSATACRKLRLKRSTDPEKLRNALSLPLPQSASVNPELDPTSY